MGVSGNLADWLGFLLRVQVHSDSLEIKLKVCIGTELMNVLNLNRCVGLALLSVGLWAIPSQVFGQPINEDLKIFTDDGLANDNIGAAVAIADGLIVMGATGNDEHGSNSGAVYVFDAVTGVQLMKLFADDAAISDNLGGSVSIDNGIIIAGATGVDDLGSRSGAAYLFDASTGEQLFKLIPNDGAANDKFGSAVAISNGIVAIAAVTDDDNGSNSGSAYLFDASTGVQLFKLLPDDGIAADAFGSSIAISGGVVAVGSSLDDTTGAGQSGSVFLFDAITGNQYAKLIPGNGGSGDEFGDSVSIAGGIVAVGAPAHDGDGIGANSGSAYLFSAASGFQLFELTPIDGEIADLLGRSISIHNGIVAVGAIGDDDLGSGSGSAYLFNANDGTPISKLQASDGLGSDVFGQSVGVHNGIVVVGAKQGDGNVINSGAAYIFGIQQAGCLADLSGDMILNFFDISAFLSAFASNDPVADFTNDGIYDFFDVSAFLSAFSAGCP